MSRNDCQAVCRSITIQVMKRLFWLVMLACLAGLAQAHAQTLDDQYVRIYNLIQQGDLLEDNAQLSPALGKFLEAQTALQKFQKVNPDWNPKVLTFRLNYLAGKIANLSSIVPAPPTPVPVKPAPVPDRRGVPMKPGA